MRRQLKAPSPTAPAIPAPPVHEYDPPALAADFEAIIERVYSIDPLDDYDRLEAALSIGGERATYGVVLEHLDNAETNARLAHKLYLSAKLERERWEAEAESTRAGMWNEASRVLQREKDAGTRSKQITDGDVRSMCAAMYPDQYAAHETKRAKVKGAEAHLERLAELWQSRCRTLQTIIATLRK